MGVPQIGDIIKINDLQVTGYPKPTIEYKWIRDDLDISGATGATYEVQGDDVGYLIGVTITIKNPYGKVINTIDYNYVDGSLAPPVFLQQPNIDFFGSFYGPPVVGAVCKINNIQTQGTPSPEVFYQWLSDNVEISGATAQTYTITSSDVGNRIGCRLTASNVVGSAITTIEVTDVVSGENLGFTGTSAIIRPESLTNGNIASVGTDITGADSIIYAFRADFTAGVSQLQQSGTSSDFLVPDSMVGRTLDCVVTGSKTGETDIVLTTQSINVTEYREGDGPTPNIGLTGSFEPQGSLTPGSGFSRKYYDYEIWPYPDGNYGSTLDRFNLWRQGTQHTTGVDAFGSDSVAIFRLGEPTRAYIHEGQTGLTLDMYAFHASGIQGITLSCNNGPSVTAGYVQEGGGNTGQGRFFFPIKSSNFTAGTTYDLRATATPVNGYAREQKTVLVFTQGTKEVEIDTSSTIVNGYNQIVDDSDYDPLKRNIVKLTESGDYVFYDAENDSGSRPKDDGTVEVTPNEGVVPVLDFVNKQAAGWGDGAIMRPGIRAMTLNNIHFKRNAGVYPEDWITNFGTSTPTAAQIGRGGIYIEDGNWEFQKTTADDIRWIFNGCTFENDIFSTDNWRQDPAVPGYGSFFRNASYPKQIVLKNCYAEGSVPYVGVNIVDGCTSNHCFQDAYTNSKLVVNTSSLEHLTPADSRLHADHFQVFANYTNPSGRNYIDNHILYNYTGTDHPENSVQPFGYFGSNNIEQTYDNIAIVNGKWTSVAPNSPVQAGMGGPSNKTRHTVIIGTDSVKSLNFNVGNRLGSEAEYESPEGAVLVAGVTHGGLNHEFLNEMDLIFGVTYQRGATNSFKSIGNYRSSSGKRDFNYMGKLKPYLKDKFKLEYRLFVPAVELAKTEILRPYGITFGDNPGGGGQELILGTTGTTGSGIFFTPRMFGITRDHWKFGLGYFNTFTKFNEAEGVTHQRLNTWAVQIGPDYVSNLASKRRIIRFNYKDPVTGNIVDSYSKIFGQREDTPEIGDFSGFGSFDTDVVVLSRTGSNTKGLTGSPTGLTLEILKLETD